MDYLEEKPEKFYQVCEDMDFWPGKFAPTAVHCFFRVLHDQGRLLRVYTQNIDALERAAQLPADKIIEAHGSFATAACICCRKAYPVVEIKATMAKKQIPWCEATNECKKVNEHGNKKGIIKPDVVFFGEALPTLFSIRLQEDIPKCDLLLVIGTSLQVYPFASIHKMVGAKVPRVLINRDRVGSFRLRDEFTIDAKQNKIVYKKHVEKSNDASSDEDVENDLASKLMGLVLTKNSQSLEEETVTVRDLFLDGDCQQAIIDLATHMGLRDQLTEVQNTAKKIHGEASEKSQQTKTE